MSSKSDYSKISSSVEFFFFAMFCKPADITSDLLVVRFMVQFLSQNFEHLKKEKRFQMIFGAKNFETLFLTLWANKTRNKKICHIHFNSTVITCWTVQGFRSIV